jgi:hypothetical protein
MIAKAFRRHAINPKPTHSRLMSFTQENALDPVQRGYSLLTPATTVAGEVGATDSAKIMSL